MKVIISIYILLAFVLSGCSMYNFTQKQIEGFPTGNVVRLVCSLEHDPVQLNSYKETASRYKDEINRRGIIDYTCVNFWASTYRYETEDEFCTNEPNSRGVFVYVSDNNS